jgi:hypothetical protein
MAGGGPVAFEAQVNPILTSPTPHSPTQPNRSPTTAADSTPNILTKLCP